MKKILFATNNQTKAKRFTKNLLKHDIEIVSLLDMNIKLEVEENGKDAIENALIKARACYEMTKMTTLAMDDNLYLENVPTDKQPGMYVRRVNGKRLTDEEMIEYYTNLAKEYGENGKITARWVYGIALIVNGEEYTYTWSKNDFYIVDKPSDIVEPGYPLNTISINKKLNKYFTELTEEDKLSVKEDESNVIDFIVSKIN
ncbi:MAG: non-canonical purine NTP pyrophosphatase [Bacilli bacterium]